MVSRQLMERIYHRCDQFDYQKFGINEFWYARKAVLMLVSFYMEVNGLFEKDDPIITFNKIYDNYLDFIVFKGLSRGKVKFENMIADHEDKHYEPGEVDLDRAQFRSEDLLQYIEIKNTINLDVERLRKFLSGEEVPALPEVISKQEPSHNKDNSPKLPIAAACDQMESNNSSDNITIAENKYVFKCKNHFWDVVYNGKQTLVKDSLGMKYLAELIRQKEKSIDWLKLFTAVKGVDPAPIGGGAAIEDLSNGFDTSEGKSVRIYVGKDKKALQQEKQKLLDKIEDIKDYATEEEIDEIKSEIDDIEKYALDNIRKDGTLKENAGNRDKMINSIKAAINRSLDDIEVDLPDLRKHLHNSIVVHWQRSDPSYSPAVDIEWEL